MINKILIANRGEIACRIASTARKMGIATVAVFSDADADSLHVKCCDEAIRIGPAAALYSYLRSDKIITTARQTGADAIHPGYGFLSENAEFSEQCTDNNIIFIGPSPDSIRTMGSKSAARQSASAAGVPVLPGYDDDDQSESLLQKQADEITYPLLIKAVSGGGGKGMRVVNQSTEFISALGAVRRESLSAFNDDRVLLEKFLPIARHIEIQVFADSHGNVVHLFERDCSMQRRHQKVLEESPAPGISEKLRSTMTHAAVECARAINYIGAGTIEFLVTPEGAFYFMEMNTRLQVEHPVTEMITNQDLVEWQIRVAGGEQLPCSQQDLSIVGHAIETRIYAEAPSLGFLPSTGKLIYLRAPKINEATRIDTGVSQGDEVSIYYDPMISKLVVWAKDRETAINRMRYSLSNYVMLGVQNNISFLSRLVSHSEFIKGQIDTRFIEKNLDALVQGKIPDDDILICASYYLYLTSCKQITADQASQNDQWSPWAEGCGWQNELVGRTVYKLDFGSGPQSIEIRMSGPSTSVVINGSEASAEAKSIINPTLVDEYCLSIQINGIKIHAAFVMAGSQLLIYLEGECYTATYIDPRYQDNSSEQSSGALTAPMPGTVIAVLAKPNDNVAINDPLMIIEAMKMEHTVKANADGKVESVHFSVGDQVNDGDVLLVIE